jgi:hypothetical protein
MEEQVKDPIQVRNVSSLSWTPPLGLAKVGAARPINPIGAYNVAARKQAEVGIAGPMAR